MTRLEIEKIKVPNYFLAKSWAEINIFRHRIENFLELYNELYIIYIFSKKLTFSVFFSFNQSGNRIRTVRFDYFFHTWILRVKIFGIVMHRF